MVKILQIVRSLVRSQLVSVDFSIDIKSFRSHYGPGVDSASNRNEYQEYFLGGKGGRCVRLTTLPPSCAAVMKSASLNFLEPSGPVQACSGTVLPLALLIQGVPLATETDISLIPTKFEQQYVRCVGNEDECVCSTLQISLQYPH